MNQTLQTGLVMPDVPRPTLIQGHLYGIALDKEGEIPVYLAGFDGLKRKWVKDSNKADRRADKQAVALDLINLNREYKEGLRLVTFIEPQVRVKGERV